MLIRCNKSFKITTVGVIEQFSSEDILVEAFVGVDNRPLEEMELDKILPEEVAWAVAAQ